MSISIPTFPALSCVINADATGTVTVNGVAHDVHAVSVSLLRVGITARAAATAREVNRPVELRTTDLGFEYLLAVHPDGFVQQFTSDRKVADVPVGELRKVATGPCVACGKDVSVAYNFCIHCRHRAPLDLIETPAQP